MGTFAPIVDYLTAMKILKDVLNRPDRNNKLPIFLTSFGYTEADVQNSWIEYVPGTGVVNPPSREYSGSIVKVAVSHPSFKRNVAQFTIPHAASGMKLRIVDAKGTLIKTLLSSFDETSIAWDGTNGSGKTVPTGNYFITIAAGTVERTGKIVVSK